MRSMEEARIGVYVCWCGNNIAKMVDVELVTELIGKLPHVVVSKNYKYMCSDPGQELIAEDILEHNLNRVVVAACSPRIHELTFRKVLEKSGLNPYLFEMANIREQDSWVHDNREAATRKAVELVAGAISRVQYHEPLDKRSVGINPATLVIGGGVAGMSAALEVANAGREVYLLEKTEQLGGMVSHFDLTFPYLYDADKMLEVMIRRTINHPHIKVFYNTTISEVHGYIGNFETTIQSDSNQEQTLTFGNIIVATGLRPFDASRVGQYGYGRLPNVITSVEFEDLLRTGQVRTKEGNIPQNIAIIHCVGSRNTEFHEYCSRTCCQVALKFANQLRSLLPDSNIYDLYADMRAFGKGCEELYTATSKKEIIFMMFDQQHELPQIIKSVAPGDPPMLIFFREKISGLGLEIPADMIILMVGMEAHPDVKDIAHAVGISICSNAFFIEKHPKLDPVATTTSGVYIVGNCQGPKGIPDSVAQAKAAAARVLATINQGSVHVEVTTAEVNETLCCGCQTCIMVCPYTAIHYDREKKVSVVNEVLCKGCGTCGSTCPTGAIRSKHFTDQQILSQIDGLMKMALKIE
ncbi:MAG: CoB--CoM heterodisulfide reductase iron-sulfur subunit A family protein [Bacteroidetes bacterium]|nr:MAG: CoB--CoM heterodisulfide reductase iron-sulfur subunit A family protein [Bacteroidota bacterium]